MRLFEHEGKALWRRYHIPTPEGIVLSSADISTALPGGWRGYVAKAQTYSGHRADHGLIRSSDAAAQAHLDAAALLREATAYPEMTGVLVEERLPFSRAIYLSIAYSTSTRGPVLLLADAGGTGIEHRTEAVTITPLDPHIGVTTAQIRRWAYPVGLTTPQINDLAAIGRSLWQCFTEQDCIVAEINPLVWDGSRWVALDAKVELDDDAAFRHPGRASARQQLRRLPTAAELAAWQIDVDDHRGVAGSSYIDLDGDIGILASGGGASLACLDALIARGGKPANYTEYSGNPPRDKVRRLTEIVLAKPGLNGCWVVGATANFTDILETLSGFLDGVRNLPVKPTYPFIIRRAGPHDVEAFALLRQAAEKEGYDFRLYGAETPMITTAKLMVDAADTYRHAHPR